MSFDWMKIRNADVDVISNNEDAADDYYTILSLGDIDRENDREDLFKLFEVTRAVMNMKSIQYEAAIEEMEKMTQEVATDREKELLIEVDRLQTEIMQYKNHSGTGERYLRAEISSLEQRIKLLEHELSDTTERLLKEQSSYDKINTRFQNLEVTYSDNKRELDRAHMDIKEYQRQFHSQRENMTVRRTDMDDVREQIHKKNKELSEYLDEIKQLQVVNDKQSQDVENVKKELEQATNDMNNITNDYTKLKTVLEDTDAIVEDMRKERDILRSQIQDMTIQLQNQAEGDDRIMGELNEKVAQWKEVLASKDEEIGRLKEEIVDIDAHLQAARVDSDRNAMIELAQANEKKDDQIKELKQKVEIATQDYNSYTAHMNTLKSKAGDESSSLYQQKKIQKLNETLKQEQKNKEAERQRVVEVEHDVIDKDKQITDLLNRLIQYENGQYGLSEAVQEIKDCRSQIRIRDRNIEELTTKVNGLYIEVNDLALENEELRARLGIESRDEIDIESLREKKAVKEEQTHALNRALHKEIEHLEEERVQLKQALRKQALERGQQAVKLGVSSLDLEVPDRAYITARPQVVKTSEERIHEKVDLSKEDIEDYAKQNNDLLGENQELRNENSKLEIGLREIHGALRTGVGATSQIQIPALDTLIAIIEQKHATGQYDTTVKLKDQLSNLTGRNEELRSELQNARTETNRFLTELEKKSQKIVDLEKENDSLREVSQGVIKLNPLPLPEGINPTSKDIIACLNEYLIQVLQELSNKEDVCSEMEKCLEDCRRKYSVLMHQQSITYKEYLEAKKEIEEERATFERERSKVLDSKEDDQTRLREFDKLLERLDASPDTREQQIVEMTRKITVLRVNEKSLARRYTLLQEVESNLRKENSKIKQDNIDIEAAVATKVGELERHKAMSVYKITALQKSLDTCVPSSELELSNNRFNELTAKYRDLLQRENKLVERSSTVETLQAELQAQQHTCSTLKENLLLQKERSYVLEQTLNELLHKMGKEADGVSYQTEEICSLARKLATLEMKELNEREKAEHATQKYEQIKSLIDELERRNSELELKFAQISKLNLNAQRIERELSEKLATCVPADVNRKDKHHIMKLEEREAELSIECDRLKEISEVARHQTKTLSMHQQSLEKEMVSLRKQLYEMQMETDQKVIIAKLHQQIIAMQVSEATAVRKLEIYVSRCNKKESYVLKLQKQLNELTESMFHVRSEGRSKVNFLKKMLQDLRRQFSGALPLGHQERFSETLRSLQEKKIELEGHLAETKEKHYTAEHLSMELKVKFDGLQELIATLKDGQGARKVTEWHNRMSEIKLEDMKLKHKIMQQNEQLAYLEKIKANQENAIQLLEVSSVKLTKEHEDRQLLWEQHEVELERTITKLEKQQNDVMETARKFEEATGSIPDESLPIANQLEVAVVKIKEHIRTIILTRSENKRLNEMLQELEERQKKIENTLLLKDKVINELRLGLPLNERNMKIATECLREPTMENREAKQAVKIAQTTVESFKLMLQRKDENLVKYQNMLNQSREELRSVTETHRQELKVLQERLQLEIDEHVKKIKKVHHGFINAPQAEIPTSKQLARLAELEEMINEQDSALGTASVKYCNLQKEFPRLKEEWEGKLQAAVKNHKQEEQKLLFEIKMQKKETEEERNIVREKDLEIEVLTQELDNAKEANKRAPSRTMKNLVERLKIQLEKKDKEQKSLSHALSQLRSDMVATAEENVHAYAKKAEQEVNVHQLINKETSELHARIEDLQNRLKKIKIELKKKKDDEMLRQSEVETLRKDVQRKEVALREMALELKNKEEFQEKYEKLKLDNTKLEKQQVKKRVEEEPLKNETAPQPSSGNDMTDLDEKPVKETKEHVIRWEESKKWQKKTESLKMKLKEKSDELVRLEKSNSMLRDALTRQERDKLSMQNRLRSLSRSGVEPSGANLEHEETIANLKTRIFQIEEENNGLCRQLKLDRSMEIEELRVKNNQLKESLLAWETQLISLQQDPTENCYNWSLQREQKFQKEILELRKELMEIGFDKEQALKDAPRLKARVADLTEYADILKSEVDSVKNKERGRKGAGGGQSIEDMERVITAMRRVVERVQLENENLKKSTVAGKSKPHCELMKENRSLKQELQRFKQMQANENKRSSKPSNKVLLENEKLLKGIQKERAEIEKLRLANQSLDITNEKLQQQVEEKNQAINEMDCRMSPNKEMRSPQGFVINKLYEEKVKSLEDELEKKKNIMASMKSHLRESVEREAGLLKKVEELEEKVILLQDLITDDYDRDEMTKRLVESRLNVKRLEDEKQQLSVALRTRTGMQHVGMTEEETLEKVNKRDRLVTTELELRNKLKELETEVEASRADNRKLKKELGAFDPAFFEELEDLKYNYKQALERNILYEQQLEELSQKFGVELLNSDNVF